MDQIRRYADLHGQCSGQGSALPQPSFHRSKWWPPPMRAFRRRTLTRRFAKLMAELEPTRRYQPVPPMARIRQYTGQEALYVVARGICACERKQTQSPHRLRRSASRRCRVRLRRASLMAVLDFIRCVEEEAITKPKEPAELLGISNRK